MEKLLLVAALACQPGDRLIDLSLRAVSNAAATSRLRFCAYQSAQVVFA
jgi:hypothetical protein